MLKRLLVSSVVAAAALIPAAGAGAGDHSCTSLVLLGAGPIYVDVRDEPGNLWIYEESNGIAGLQPGGPGDEVCMTFDAAGQPITPDTVIF